MLQLILNEIFSLISLVKMFSENCLRVLFTTLFNAKFYFPFFRDENGLLLFISLIFTCIDNNILFSDNEMVENIKKWQKQDKNKNTK